MHVRPKGIFYNILKKYLLTCTEVGINMVKPLSLKNPLSNLNFESNGLHCFCYCNSTIDFVVCRMLMLWPVLVAQRKTCKAISARTCSASKKNGESYDLHLQRFRIKKPFKTKACFIFCMYPIHGVQKKLGLYIYTL